MARNFSDKTFTKILRGYSPDEVKEYIQYIDNEYKKLERVSADNVRKLALALRKLDEMNNYAEQLEKQLEDQAVQQNEALPKVDYEELARLKNETLERANREAEAILADAKEKSNAVITEAREKSEAIVTEAEELARSVRDKILIEAASKAEGIIKEAQARTEETRRSAETMGAAAMKMYSEVLSFRDTLFEAYNVHIESIEEIIETADELFGDEEADDVKPADDIPEDDETEVEIEIEIDDEDDELIGAVDISEYDEMLESLEEEADELKLDMSEFRDIIDELPLSEAASALEDDFVVVGDADETEFVSYTEESNDFETITDAEDEFEATEIADEVIEPEYVPAIANDETWISAEEWDAENSGEFTEDYETAAEQYAVVADSEDETYAEEVADHTEELNGDTYESYGETYAEDVEDEVDPIELEAQKYSDVYTEEEEEDEFYAPQPSEDDLLYPDFENAEYAPAPEYSWGDDMYVEPEGEEEYAEEYIGGYTEENSQEYAPEYDNAYDEAYDEDFTDEYYDEGEFAEELPAAPVYEEDDELDRLKQFFSADFDEAAANNRREYDAASNSTTSIALSLNDFFGNSEGADADYGYGEDDMESLFEQRPDMSVTDEFDIVFGKSDSAKSVAEIRRQPIIAPEKPGKHKKRKKF